MKTDRKKGLILIVDDAQVNLELAKATLQREGYELVTADHPSGVSDWVEENQPDLILLDVMMPEVNGITLCRELKARPATKDIPIIFLTAKASPEDIVEGLKSGGADYVCKPFVPEELKARVRVHIQLYHQKKELRQKTEELQESLDKFAKLSNAMLKVCAWTKQVQVGEEWIPAEEYLSKHLGISLTHGISDQGIKKLKEDIQS